MEEYSQLVQKRQKRQTYKSQCKITLIVLNIALSSFYFGYCIAYFGQLDIHEMKQIFQFGFLSDKKAKMFLNGCIPVGAIIGALLSIIYITKFSRRKSLLSLNLIAFIAGGFLYIHNFYTLLIFRTIQGICVGGYSAIVPLIIKELAPIQISGKLGSYAQLLTCTGVFFGCLLNYILYILFKISTEQICWYVFAVPEVIVVVQSILLWKVFPYETPKYLFSVNKIEEAKKLIQLIYKPQDVNEIIQNHTSNLIANATVISQSSLIQGQTNKIPTCVPTIVAVYLAVLQQFSGINAVVVYGLQIAKKAFFFQNLQNQISASLINIGQVIATFVTGYLLNRFGRKQILQFGTFFLGIANLLLAIGFLILPQSSQPKLEAGTVCIIIGLFLYMAVFGLSLGPIVWLYIPEIVPDRVVSISTATNWLCASIVIIIVPVILNDDSNDAGNQAHGWLFLSFTVWCVIAFLINWKFVVETKDKIYRNILFEYSTVGHR